MQRWDKDDATRTLLQMTVDGNRKTNAEMARPGERRYDTIRDDN